MAITIEQSFLEFIRDRTSAKIHQAVITINGQEKTFPIQTTKHSTQDTVMTVQKYVYLDEVDAAGSISNARLVDSEGKKLITSDAQITSLGTGALLLFEIKFVVEVSGSDH